MEDKRNNAPGAGQDETMEDPKNQLEQPTANLNDHIPQDSLFEGQADPLNQSTIFYYAYPTVGQHVDQYALSEEVIFVQKSQVLLAEYLGLSIADLLEQICAKSDYMIFFVRENERTEFEVSVGIDTLRRSRTSQEKFDKRKS